MSEKKALKAYLYRAWAGPDCVLGYLTIGHHGFFTLERPWLDNARNKSCIPSGTYNAKFLPRSASGKYRDVYHLQSVEGRGGILIHNGNIVDHTRGCILLGLRKGFLKGKRAVLNSKSAMREFTDATERKNLLIRVIDPYA